jgi:hypothetical protein
MPDPPNAPADQSGEEARRVGADVLAQRTWDETTAISPAPTRSAPRRTEAPVGRPAIPPGQPGASAAVTPEQIVATLEQLAGLRDRGILSAGGIPAEEGRAAEPAVKETPWNR